MQPKPKSSPIENSIMKRMKMTAKWKPKESAPKQTAPAVEDFESKAAGDNVDASPMNDPEFLKLFNLGKKKK